MELFYIGSKDGVEKRIIEKAGVEYFGVSCGKMRRYFSLQNVVDFFKLPVGVWQARGLLKRLKPDVVFSKGGYVSVPVVVAAGHLGIRIVAHESDVMPGLATKIALRYADKVCVSFEESLQYIKDAIVTGNPVRDGILNGEVEKGRKFTGLDIHRPVILVMGGSQGAVQINELVRASMDELLKKFQIVHVRGRGNLDISLHRKGYVQYEYLDEQLADVYAMCDMVVSRGGANSLAEIAILKKKALIIPLGTEGSRGDQIENTKVCAAKYGWSVLNGKVGYEDFVKAVEMAYANDVRGVEVEAGTAAKITKIILGK